MLNCDEIEQKVIQNRKLHKLPMYGIASSNIRRQIKRLRQIFLVEKVKTRYRINEHDSLTEVFNEKIEPFLIKTTIQRIKQYLDVVDEQFK